jgi:hypothetical protein
LAEGRPERSRARESVGFHAHVSGAIRGALRRDVDLTDPIDHDDLRDQYRLALDEYRFQVNLNWTRSQYYFALNLGVLVAATSLLAAATRVPHELIAAIFLLGALLASISIFANYTGHTYYRETRDLKTRLEHDLGLGDRAIATTPGMGSARHRLEQSNVVPLR